MYEKVFKESNERVTLPKRKDLNNESYLTTDYAIALGVASSFKNKIKVNKTGKTALCMLSEPYDEKYIGVRDFDGKNAGIVAGSHDIGIMPIFEFTKDSNISSIKENDNLYLTINGKKVLYPQTFAGKSLSQELTKLFENDKLKHVGWFTSDGTSMLSLDDPFVEKSNRAYLYNEKVYCHVKKAVKGNHSFSDDTICNLGEEYWFECEPIQVQEISKGVLGCSEVIAVGQFETQNKYESLNLETGQELDTDDFAIGTFLNDYFFEDLIRSTELLKEQKVGKITFNFQRDILGIE